MYFQFETSVGIKPKCKDAILKLLEDLAVEEDNNGPDILKILNTSLMAKLQNEDGNVCNA
jgi:hypothetical protein